MPNINPGEMERERRCNYIRATHALIERAVSGVAGSAALVTILPDIPLLWRIASAGVALTAAYYRFVELPRLLAEKLRLHKCDPASPLVLDLDGDGVEAGGVAFFDHGGDGFAELTRWAGADDGMLVWDRNGDGVINDGSELFGNNTALANGKKAAHGFAALAQLDGNGDGLVDSRDSGWSDLRVMRWTDANNNGVKDSGEESLVSLAFLSLVDRIRRGQFKCRKGLTFPVFVLFSRSLWGIARRICGIRPVPMAGAGGLARLLPGGGNFGFTSIRCWGWRP